MKKTLAALLAALAFCATPQTAEAGSMEDGIRLYNAKDYRGARPHFELAARNSPMSWQAHFYLASTMMATGDLEKARNEFITAQKITTNPEIGRRCREGLERVNKMLSGGSASSTARGGSISSTSNASSGSTGTAYSPAEAEAAKNASGNAQKRNEIMAKARAQCASIRQEAAEQIKAEKERSNSRFQYQDGSVGYDISDDREAEIKRDAEDKCKRIMEIAEQTIKSYK